MQPLHTRIEFSEEAVKRIYEGLTDAREAFAPLAQPYLRLHLKYFRLGSPVGLKWEESVYPLEEQDYVLWSLNEPRYTAYMDTIAMTEDQRAAFRRAFKRGYYTPEAELFREPLVAMHYGSLRHLRGSPRLHYVGTEGYVLQYSAEDCRMNAGLAPQLRLGEPDLLDLPVD